MEINDLRYFVAIANKQNLQQVSRDVSISASALSKVIARLEWELEKPLFTRRNKRIYLTEEGNKLRSYANQIISLEKDAQVSIRGDEQAIHVRVAGPEACLLYVAPIIRSTLAQLPNPIHIQFSPMSEVDSFRSIEHGDNHMAAVCLNPWPKMKSKLLSKIKFKTFASKRHKLVKTGGSTSISIQQVLKFPFVASEPPLFGSITENTIDGWRDDKFPRLIKFRTASLKILDELVASGEALAYLPSYYGESLSLVPLEISGCPYMCEQNLRIVANRPDLYSWLRLFF